MLEQTFPIAIILLTAGHTETHVLLYAYGYVEVLLQEFAQYETFGEYKVFIQLIHEQEA